MIDIIEKFPVQRVTREGREAYEDTIPKELPFTIILNNKELVTLLCSPTDLDCLAVGFLLSEGLISNKDEIKKVITDDRRGVAHVETEEGNRPEVDLLFNRLITSGCGSGAHFYSFTDATSKRVESRVNISAAEVLALSKEFLHNSQVYQITHGVHSAALCDNKAILVFNEDIGRHNAVDKIFGKCLLKDIPTSDRIIITSGRITSEIVLKVAKRDIPVIISKAAPTNLGVRLADDLGVTLIGFVRGQRMNVYTNNQRVTN